MIDVYRVVAFACGHTAGRLAGGGRTLVGERIRCDACGHDKEVVGESPALTRLQAHAALRSAS